jgi:hypothetical protein
MLIQHANLIIIDRLNNWDYLLYDFCKQRSNQIVIMAISRGALVDKAQYDAWNKTLIEYSKEKNCLVFYAGGNI